MKIKEIMVMCCLTLVIFSCKETVEGGDGLLMTGTSSDKLVKFAIDEQSSYAISVTSTVCIETNVKINLDVNPDLVTAYNEEMGTKYYPVPEGVYMIDTKEVVISAGQAVSSSSTVSINEERRGELVDGRLYLIPVTIVNAESDLNIIEANRTIFLKLSKTLYFSAPYVGTTAMTNEFTFANPVVGMTQYTWEVRFKAENFNKSSVGEPIRIGGWNNNMLRFGEGGVPGNELEVYAGTQKKLAAKTRFAVDTWYMLSIVNDGKTLTLYVNGEKDNSMSVSTDEYEYGSYVIGQSLSGYESKQLFHGWLGGMRIWSRALSGREIKTGLCGVDPNASGLEAYYPMNEGEGKTFHDLSPNKRDMVYQKNITVKWTEANNKCVE